MVSWKDNAVAKYLLESQAELGKVIWPSRTQIIRHSLLVIGISLGLGLYFGLADYLLSRGLESLLVLTR
jgi:preprotein translocase SecE subunit